MILSAPSVASCVHTCPNPPQPTCMLYGPFLNSPPTFPSPNPSKFLVCTSTHHFSHCFFRLSSHFCLGSCGSPYVDKRATGAPSTPLYPCTSFHSQRISLFFVLAVFAKELFFATLWLHFGEGPKKVPLSLLLRCHYVCQLAPIPPNPPARSMALSPSPNPAKFLVCI